jgi:hypothetical protein
MLYTLYTMTGFIYAAMLWSSLCHVVYNLSHLEFIYATMLCSSLCPAEYTVAKLEIIYAVVQSLRMLYTIHAMLELIYAML